MGSLALLVVYTIVIGIIELELHITVGQVILHVIRMLAGGG